MSLSGPRITQLCETWQEQASGWDASSGMAPRQGRYAEELLRLLGWETPLPFSPQEISQGLGARPYILRAQGRNAFVAYFVQPGTIDAPSAVLERGLDFCPATRMLAEEAHAMGFTRALITDMYRAYLYDTASGELLRAADNPHKFNDDVVPVLVRDRVDLGALDDLRGPSRTGAARQLRAWCDRWTRLMARHARITEEKASLVLDRLLVMRFLFEREILRRTRPRLEQRFYELVERAGTPRPHGVGQALVALFHDMWLDWRLDAFEAMPDLDRALQDDEIAVPMLREFSLLADSKFTFDTILESFNYGDPGEKQRVRMVPDTNEERDEYLAAQTLRTVDEARIEIDLTEEGYRALTLWFDRVIALYDRIEQDFRKMFYAPDPANADGSSAADLFGWAVVEGERPRACADKFFHACNKGFGAFYQGFRQFRTARLILTLHLIRTYDDAGIAVERMPTLRNLLMPRPEVLTPARLMRVQEAPPVPRVTNASEIEGEITPTADESAA